MSKETKFDRNDGYLLLFGALLGALCTKGCMVQGIESKLQQIDDSIKLVQPQEKRANVIGGSEDEIFYEIGGKRAYVAIDGFSVTNIHSKNKIPLHLEALGNTFYDSASKSKKN